MPDEAHTAEFAKTIETEMGGTFIEFPPHREIPLKIDFEKFGENKDVAEVLVKGLNYFVNAPIIEDKYASIPGGHDEREADRSRLGGIIREKYDQTAADEFNRLATYNKFKSNVLISLDRSANYYDEFLKEDHGPSEAGTKIQETFKREVQKEYETDPDTGKERVKRDPWGEKNIEQKKAVLVDLTDSAVDMLWEMANK